MQTIDQTATYGTDFRRARRDLIKAAGEVALLEAYLLELAYQDPEDEIGTIETELVEAKEKHQAISGAHAWALDQKFGA